MASNPPTKDSIPVDEDNDSLDSSEAASMNSNLEYELDLGIPQASDPFIQKYFSSRAALIAQEKKQRHDYIWKQTMSPLARQAALIMSRIRKKELKTVWTSEFEESMTVEGEEGKAGGEGAPVYPGMMFTLARQRMETTKLWKIVERMPKGALLHAHLEAMIDVDWLIEQVMNEEGMCVLAPKRLRADSLDDSESGIAGGMQCRFYPPAETEKMKESEAGSIWMEGYVPLTPFPIKAVAKAFPNGGEAGFWKWLWNRCVITPEESIRHHHGLDAIWRKFQSIFPNIGWLLFYEPILRRALQRLFAQLAEDGITYVDLRCAFMFEFRRTGESARREAEGFMGFFEVLGEEVEKFKQSEVGKRTKFEGARMIWTVVRRLENKMIIDAMIECLRIKKAFPHIVCGFDFVAQEDMGRPLTELTPLIFWFRKRCVEEGVEIPFFFHAGECLGDGNETDENLFDAILLGTRRIGHGYSLYKHPLLIDMVKQKKILVESCPISNEILRLASSILGHSLPALLSRGVSVSLNNDDPAILGHGKNGLSHDFWQAYMAFENLGLEGLAVMAENSIKWCAVEDEEGKEWVQSIEKGYLGKGVKARMLRDWRAEFEKWCQWVIMEFAEEDDDGEDGGAETA
jgi:adenosine deaminase CECR1